MDNIERDSLVADNSKRTNIFNHNYEKSVYESNNKKEMYTYQNRYTSLYYVFQFSTSPNHRFLDHQPEHNKHQDDVRPRRSIQATQDVIFIDPRFVKIAKDLCKSS